MPLLRITTSNKFEQEKEIKILNGLSKILENILKKPEKYIQLIFHSGISMNFAGSKLPNAFIEIKSIGALSPDNCNTLSSSICSFLNNEINIPPDRVYIQFEDVQPTFWGFNNKTFA